MAQCHVGMGGASRRTASGASYAPPSPAIASLQDLCIEFNWSDKAEIHLRVTKPNFKPVVCKMLWIKDAQPLALTNVSPAKPNKKDGPAVGKVATKGLSQRLKKAIDEDRTSGNKTTIQI